MLRHFLLQAWDAWIWHFSRGTEAKHECALSIVHGVGYPVLKIISQHDRLFEALNISSSHSAMCYPMPNYCLTNKVFPLSISDSCCAQVLSEHVLAVQNEKLATKSLTHRALSHPCSRSRTTLGVSQHASQSTHANHSPGTANDK